MSNPNIIFIVLDTLRADRIPSNFEHTPFIKSLSNNSIYFQNCISNSPWTIPSHISMFTGLYPSQIAKINGKSNKLNSKIPILTEILKTMNYFTICFSENDWISDIYGLTRGFDLIIRGQKADINWRNKNKITIKSLKFLDKIEKFLIMWVSSKYFLKFLQKVKFLIMEFIRLLVKIFLWRNIFYKHLNDTFENLDNFRRELTNHIKSEPFYLYFNIMATHNPYLPKKYVLDHYKIKDWELRILKNFFLKNVEYLFKINFESIRLTKKEVLMLKKMYDASTFYGDFIVKKIISILKKLNLLENSFLIITSDHGEHLCDQRDHYFWEHSTYQSVYEAVLKVPLLIYNKNFKKRIINRQIQLKDLFHTILHMTGIPIPQNKYLDINSSIIHQIENNSTPEYIFGEYPKYKEQILDIHNYYSFKKKNLFPKISNNIYFLRTNEYKLIKYNNIKIEEFFNLLSDPFEQINIINLKNENFNNLKAKLEEILTEINKKKKVIELITKKEKNLIKSTINQINLNEI